jgi:anti-sigma regulatory factor (Ser/Thr protein kinase)
MTVRPDPAVRPQHPHIGARPSGGLKGSRLGAGGVPRISLNERQLTMTPIAPPADAIDGLTATWPLHTHVDLLAQPSSVPNARRFTGLILTEWALADPADSTRLVVSELVTNALDHTASAPVHLWLFSDGARVVVLVGDASPDPPVRIAEDTSAIGGRGLTIVHDLTGGNWGWFPCKDGKVVWALVSRPGTSS